METRVAKLESHFEYIRRDLDSVATDVRELRKEVHDEFKEVRLEFKEVRKETREDFRILFGALVVVALGMASLMAKGFGWL